RMMLAGQMVKFMVGEQGDTLIIADLEDVSISSPRKFASREDYLRYKRYRRYAVKVYPYANEAIQIFRDAQSEAEDLSKGKRKKYMRKKTKELKEEFETPLKKLTKTQGRIMVKMIEKELDTPMYELIKGVRGTMTASYWNTLSKFYGHRLKEKYEPGEDKILDAVLNDLTLKYD
ncbi:MAG: DUF4294 domain-containing protein, partial [Bacteroidota bacterium]